MKTLKKELEVALNDELSAKIIIERAGQDYASSSDDVRVLGTICLPVQQYDYLKSSLEFGNRCSVLGESLNSTWGYYSEELKMRTKKHMITGTSFAEMFISMEHYLKSELVELITMLELRAETLRNAE